MLYKVFLKKGTLVGTEFIDFDHWVSVRASDMIEAKYKAIHKLAWQMLYGDNWEFCFRLNYTPLRSVKADIDIGDLEVYE